MSEALQLLGGLTVEQFLDEYWQKKPLLVRNAFPGFHPSLSADELAGLACEPEVESRIILEKDGPAPWTVEHGPFKESRFNSLPETHWTLLVQGVDSWVPEVAEVIEPFRFIPDWRIDDIMISYAPEHGSVGPHLDQYDVFLVQAQGHRRWQINTKQYNDDDCIPGIALSILKHFKSEQEWILAPGDMLYLPPQVAHYGVAQDDCMTYSVGFRAPAQAEIISAFTDDLMTGLPQSQRYEDKDLLFQDNPGEISAQTLEQVQDIIRLKNLENALINRWFGKYITEPKHQPGHNFKNLDPTGVKQLLIDHATLHRDLQSRFAFIRSKTDCFFYVNGDEYVCQCELAEYLCQNKHYDSQQVLSFFSNENTGLITSLINSQLLFTTDE